MPNNHTITPHLQDEDAEANCSLEPGADQLDHKCRKCNLDRTDKEWQWEGSPIQLILSNPQGRSLPFTRMPSKCVSVYLSQQVIYQLIQPPCDSPEA